MYSYVLIYICVFVRPRTNLPTVALPAAMYYRGAAAAIVVYDITRASSFNTLKHWVDELKTKGPKDIAIAIAGNKADLDHMRVS